MNVFVYFRHCPEGCKGHFAVHSRAQWSRQRCVALGQGTRQHGNGSSSKCLCQGLLGLLVSCPGRTGPQGGRGRMRPSLQGSCACRGGWTLPGHELTPAGRGEVKQQNKLQSQQDKGLLLPFILKYCLIVWALYFFSDSAVSRKGAVTH